jgi:hypothetical protein
MMISRIKPIFSVLLFLFLFSLVILNQFAPTIKATQGRSGEDGLKISEHRLSVVQDEKTNLFTVYDEFWITNSGEEPYNNLVYNSLPEEIAIEEGMFCKISEAGEHTCFDWRHQNNNYFWDGNYVILPKNYAKKFELKIQATSIENKTNSFTINKLVDSSSEAVEELIETDDWNWIRDGFYHGWRTFVNFTIKNTKNQSETFELEIFDFPAGVRLELVEDSNANSIFDSPDNLMAFDSDYDGKWESVPTSDSDNNSVPDISLNASESRSFLVYLRADYKLHFLTKYQKQIEPSSDGIVEFNKKTIYDTSLMRVYIIPNEKTSIYDSEINFEKRLSEDTLYYYGEWSGNRDNEVTFQLKKETINTIDSNDPSDQILSISVIIILVVLLLAIIGFRAKMKKDKEIRAKEIERKKRLMAKKKKAEVKTRTSKAAPKKIEKTEKQTKALSRLEEDYKAGNLDEEIYEELKERYSSIEED